MVMRSDRRYTPSGAISRSLGRGPGLRQESPLTGGPKGRVKFVIKELVVVDKLMGVTDEEFEAVDDKLVL